MKSKIRITDEFVKALPEQMQDGLDEALKECEEDEPILKRRPSVNDFQIMPDENMTAINYASTRSIDRDKEIVIPSGVNLAQFKKSPVLLFGHQWSEPPIGSDKQIKADGYGLLAKSVFADTAKGEEIWKLVSGNHLKTSSIGFVPMQVVRNGTPEFGKVVDKLCSVWEDFKKEHADEVRAIILKSMLLEHSIVSVPANIDALVLAVSSKSLDLTAKTLQELGVDVKIEDDYDWLKDLPNDKFDFKTIDKKTETLDDKKIEKFAPKLVARLIMAPEKKVKAYTEAEMRAMVQEAMDLAKGKI